jgi:hypothetical protein
MHPVHFQKQDPDRHKAWRTVAAEAGIDIIADSDGDEVQYIAQSSTDTRQQIIRGKKINIK